MGQEMARVVAAVRKDPKIGEGSCSVVDECLTDQELAELIVAWVGGPPLTEERVIAGLREYHDEWHARFMVGEPW